MQTLLQSEAELIEKVKILLAEEARLIAELREMGGVKDEVVRI